MLHIHDMQQMTAQGEVLHMQYCTLLIWAKGYHRNTVNNDQRFQLI